MRAMEFLARELFAQLDKWSGGDLESRKIGMCLFIFSFQGGELTYISNADREGVIKMLLEFITKNAPAQTWDEQHG